MLTDELIFLMARVVLVLFGCIVIAMSAVEIVRTMFFVFMVLFSISFIVKRVGYTSQEEFVP